MKEVQAGLTWHHDMAAVDTGICLGHQGLGSVHGGRVKRAPTPMHGRLARIRHSARGIFKGLPPDFLVSSIVT